MNCALTSARLALVTAECGCTWKLCCYVNVFRAAMSNPRPACGPV